MSSQVAMNVFAGLIVFAVLSGCTPNRRIVESSATPAPVTTTPAPRTIDNDLEAMRTANFKFILVFRRKDGEVMTAEDKAFINANTPPDANRRRLSDDGKAVIIGSNFPFMPGMIGNLTDRFLMIDHSAAEAGPLEVDRTANSNAGQPTNK